MKRGSVRSIPKRGRGGRSGLNNREDVDSPAPTKNGKETSNSPGPGSGGDSSGTVPTRRGRPGHGGTNGTNGIMREPSMTELKKRASLMLDLIAQSQLEMARSESRILLARKPLTPPSAAADKMAATLAGDLATRLVKWQHEFTIQAMIEGSEDV